MVFVPKNIIHILLYLILVATDLINQQIHMMTDTGNKCQEILVRGEAIPEDMVIKMIEEKINSQEVTHHGRVTILTQKYSHMYSMYCAQHNVQLNTIPIKCFQCVTAMFYLSTIHCWLFTNSVRNLDVVCYIHGSSFVHRLCAWWLPLSVRGEPLHKRSNWTRQELET